MKRTKFDAEKYIAHNYVENQDAIISIYIKNPEAYYHEFDADDLTLSDDIFNFIDNKVENISYRYNIVLEFDSPHISEKEKDKLLNIIRSHYGLTYSLKQKILRANKLKALVFFLIGVIFLISANTLHIFGRLISDILNIAGWVSMWETVSILLFDNIRSSSNKNKIDRLYNAKIIFKERE